MKLLIRLSGLLLLLAFAQLSSCAGSADVATTLSQPLDSTIQRQVARQVGARRVKFKGPVTFQLGDGNVYAPKAQAPVAAGAGQAQDYTGAGRHGGALATAPGASSGATTRSGVPAWLIGVGVGLVLLLVLAWLIRRARSAIPLP